MTLLWMFLGLGLLVLGAEILVRGASALAKSLGLSPLLIGLTIVAYGTSTPEVFVSTQAALSGQPDIALGNVVGSNIFNVLFILGISALICSLKVSQQLIRWDVPIMIAVSLLTWLLGLDGQLSILDGALLITGLIAYTFFAIRMGKNETAEVKQEYAEAFDSKKSKPSHTLNIFFIFAGLLALGFGARLFVEGAISIARHLGISELIIALTIVAAGTSLPEIATSIMASIKGERDIAVGNVVGSNIFNILGILGISSILGKGLAVSPAILAFDIPVMVAVAIACLPIFFTGHTINRWEGLLFLGYYVSYTLYLVLKNSEHDTLPIFSQTMLWFVIPVTALTLMIFSWRHAFNRFRNRSLS